MKNDQKKPYSADDLLDDALNILYYLYLALGLAGCLFYYLRWLPALYLLSGIVVLLFLFQYGTRFTDSLFGTLWICAGLLAGWWHYRTADGACFGMMLALILRHFFKRICFRLLYWVLDRLHF